MEQMMMEGTANNFEKGKEIITSSGVIVEAILAKDLDKYSKEIQNRAIKFDKEMPYIDSDYLVAKNPKDSRDWLGVNQVDGELSIFTEQPAALESFLILSNKNFNNKTDYFIITH